MTFDKEISDTEALCYHMLHTNHAGFANRLHITPSDCFDLLKGISFKRKRTPALRRLMAEAERIGIAAPYEVERFVVLQAYLVALPRLASLPVDQTIHRQFCATCRLVAAPLRWGEDNRLRHDSDAFAELAHIVTLRRFHAGQLSFDLMKMPRSWLLKVHPLDLGSLMREIIFGIGGFGPAVIPHVNYWRPNLLYLSKGEQDRSLRRIIKSIELQPSIIGLISSSWIYCKTVGEFFPHLSWIRDFFVEHNAYVVDAGPALIDSGFLVDSDKRRRLFEEGRFRPRETLVMWRREQMLSWASDDPTLPTIRQLNYLLLPKSAKSSCSPNNVNTTGNRRSQSGGYTLIDLRWWLLLKPRSYIAAVLLMPALCATVLIGMSWELWEQFLIFCMTLLVMWLFQYFFLQ